MLVATKNELSVSNIKLFIQYMKSSLLKMCLSLILYRIQLQKIIYFFIKLNNYYAKERGDQEHLQKIKNLDSHFPNCIK